MITEEESIKKHFFDSCKKSKITEILSDGVEKQETEQRLLELDKQYE